MNLRNDSSPPNVMVWGPTTVQVTVSPTLTSTGSGPVWTWLIPAPAVTGPGEFRRRRRRARLRFGDERREQALLKRVINWLQRGDQQLLLILTASGDLVGGSALASAATTVTLPVMAARCKVQKNE